MNKNIIRIGKWTLDLDLDTLSNKNFSTGFSSFKKDMIEIFPDLVEKYRLKSKLDGTVIRKIVAWDSLIDEAIKLEILNEEGSYRVIVGPDDHSLRKDASRYSSSLQRHLSKRSQKSRAKTIA